MLKKSTLWNDYEGGVIGFMSGYDTTGEPEREILFNPAVFIAKESKSLKPLLEEIMKLMASSPAFRLCRRALEPVRRSAGLCRRDLPPLPSSQSGVPAVPPAGPSSSSQPDRCAAGPLCRLRRRMELGSRGLPPRASRCSGCAVGLKLTP